MLRSLLLVAAVLTVATCVYNERSRLLSKANTAMLQKVVKSLLESKEAETKMEEEENGPIVPGKETEREEEEENGPNVPGKEAEREEEEENVPNVPGKEAEREEEEEHVPIVPDKESEREEEEENGPNVPGKETEREEVEEKYASLVPDNDETEMEEEEERSIPDVPGQLSMQRKHYHVHHVHIPYHTYYGYHFGHSHVLLHLGGGSWPVGTYGLLMPTEQCISRNIGYHLHPTCPMGHWATGQRYHDTNDNVNHNSITPHNCLKGSVHSGGIKWNFCMQQDRTGLHRPQWPRGSYCIFKKGSCPHGFRHGSVKFDDEDGHNSNSKSGVLPDGVYTSDTIYEFCCRTDGSIHTPISLPTEVPFYLLGSTSHCQAVHGMRVHEERIFFDCENNQNINSRSGSTPYDFGHRSDHKFLLCYYHH